MQSIGYDLSSSLQPDLQSCVNSCGNVQSCTSVAFHSSTSIYPYKSQNGHSLGATADFSTAVAIDLSCPNGNGVVYMDAYGSNYQIPCDYTLPSSTQISQTNGGRRAVNERSLELSERAPADATGFLTCSIRCSNLITCIAVTTTGSTCVFISNLGPAGTGSSTADTVILVAKRIVGVDANGNAVTSTSAAASVPTVATSRSASVYKQPSTTAGLSLTSGLGGLSTSLSASLPPVSVPNGASASLGASVGASVGVSATLSAGISATLSPIVSSTDLLGGVGGGGASATSA